MKQALETPSTCSATRVSSRLSLHRTCMLLSFRDIILNMLVFFGSMTTVTYPVAVKKWNYHHLDQFRIMNLDFYVNRKSHSKPALARISGPVKLVCGSKDVAYPTSYSEKFLAHLIEAGIDASLHVIPGMWIAQGGYRM